MNEQFDIAIIGGGPVGAALALALRDSTLKICVLEARPADSSSQDARALALSYGSRLLLARLGIWDALQDISPIRTIHISQKQSFGRAVLHAEELNVPELGYVLPYPALQDALTDVLQHSDVASIYGASVTRLINSDDSRHYRLSAGWGRTHPADPPRGGCRRRQTAGTAISPENARLRTECADHPHHLFRTPGTIPRSSASHLRGRWRCCRFKTDTNWYGLHRIKPRRKCWHGTMQNFCMNCISTSVTESENS